MHCQIYMGSWVVVPLHRRQTNNITLLNTDKCASSFPLTLIILPNIHTRHHESVVYLFLLILVGLLACFVALVCILVRLCVSRVIGECMPE